MRPVDSEHSAIFQCMQGIPKGGVKKIILTGSGGTFRDMSLEDMKKEDPEVLRQRSTTHPNWDMGAKITVDSSTMMNKGLEVIEAHWLYGVEYDDIEVVIHPQSIVHSAVECQDTAILMQTGWPDMRLPILYALSHPSRVPADLPNPRDGRNFDDWWIGDGKDGKLTFGKPDLEKYPCIRLAYKAGRIGGTMPAILSAANEQAVELLLTKEIDFLDIPSVLEKVMDKERKSWLNFDIFDYRAMIRWTFSDASFLKTGLASAWHSDSVEQTLQKLKSLKLKDQRRALPPRKDFRFATCSEAIGFLQPLADQNALLRAKGTTTPSPAVCPAPAEHHSALRCPEGHAIHRKGNPFGWFQERDKKTCHACNRCFGPHTSYWRCTQNCKYNVCHHCFQMAACNEAQQMLEGSMDTDSTECTECGSDESPMDFRVSAGASVETWHFLAKRPWQMQMEELQEAFEAPSELRSCDGWKITRGSVLAFEVPHAVLIHSQGVELEVIQSISQLQALPSTAQLTLETPEQLLAQLLRDATALRPCASEELAAEGIRQAAISSEEEHHEPGDLLWRAIDWHRGEEWTVGIKGSGGTTEGLETLRAENVFVLALDWYQTLSRSRTASAEAIQRIPDEIFRSSAI
eukprot:s3130_g2.t1